MKLICHQNHYNELSEKLKPYQDINIVLIEQGEKYEGIGYQFDYQHIDQLIQYLEKLKSKQRLVGYHHQRLYTLPIEKIVYIEGMSKECYLHTMNEEYLSQYKLYELETLCEGTSLIRISKSMIVNICYIDYIQIEANMKYGLYMKSNIKLTLSRKYVKAFKKKIGMR